MTDLQSCFFCGTVQSVNSYPIVPHAVASPAEDSARVSLCESCREKYAMISDHIVDAVRSVDDGHERPRRDAARPLHIGRGGKRKDDPGHEPEPVEEEPTTPVVDRVPGPDDESVTGVDAFFGSGGVSFDDSDDDPEPEPSFPDGYHKVLRWLSNRSFPIPRTDVEEIVSSAYDLSRSDCSTAIDAAIDRGVLREKHGQLLAGTED